MTQPSLLKLVTSLGVSKTFGILLASLVVIIFSHDVISVFADLNAYRSAVMISCLLLISVLWCSDTSQSWQLKKRDTYIVLAFIIILFASSALSTTPWQNIARWAEIVLLITFGIAFCGHLQTHPHDRNYLSFVLIALPMLYIMVFVVTALVVPNAAKLSWVHSPPFISNIRFVSHLTVIAIPLTCTYLLPKRSHTSQLIAWLTMTALLSFTFWSGGRGGLLVTVIILLMVVIQHKYLMLPLLAATVVAGTIAFVLPETHQSLEFIREIEPSSSILSILNQLSSERINLTLSSLSLWWSDAFWLGFGADGFQFHQPEIVSPKVAHPHSFPIQVLITSGAVGFLLVSILTFRIARTINLRSTSPKYFSSLAISGVALLSLLEGNLYHTLSTLAVALLLCLHLSGNSGGKVRDGNPTLATHTLYWTSGAITILLTFQICLSQTDIDLYRKVVKAAPFYVHGNYLKSLTLDASNKEDYLFIFENHPQPCQLQRYGVAFSEQELSRFCQPFSIVK